MEGFNYYVCKNLNIDSDCRRVGGVGCADSYTCGNARANLVRQSDICVEGVSRHMVKCENAIAKSEFIMTQSENAMAKSEFIMSKSDYAEYIEARAPKSKLFLNSLKAFITGGIICCIGQCLSDYYLSRGFGKEQSSALTSVTLIIAGILLTGLNMYKHISAFAGAGVSVPITGFANSMASPAIEFRREGFVFGVGARMFSIAGPVLVYGLSTSIIIGVIYYFAR
jgi:stage V sporulation protein AC